MTASISSCHFDKKQTDLCTLSVDPMKGGANGVTGSYKLRYIVKMSDTCGPLNVISSGQAIIAPNDPLPALWSTYSFQGDTDAHSYCKTLNVERDPIVSSQYYVTASYEPPEPGEINESGVVLNSIANPMSRPPRYWWDRELSTKIAPVSQDGTTVLNTANNLYEELEEHERAKGLLVCEFNVATQGEVIDLSRKFDQAVNSSQWVFKGRTIGYREAMIRQISAGDCRQEGSYKYIPVAVRFAFADLGRTWDVPKPELGQSYYIKSGGAYVLDSSGFRKRGDAGTVVPLNVDGTRLPDGAQVLVSQWRMRREVNFNDLPAIIT